MEYAPQLIISFKTCLRSLLGMQVCILGIWNWTLCADVAEYYPLLLYHLQIISSRIVTSRASYIWRPGSGSIGLVVLIIDRRDFLQSNITFGTSRYCNLSHPFRENDATSHRSFLDRKVLTRQRRRYIVPAFLGQGRQNVTFWPFLNAYLKNRPYKKLLKNKNKTQSQRHNPWRWSTYISAPHLNWRSLADLTTNG